MTDVTLGDDKVTVIDRDEIIEFFKQDRNFPILSLLKKYGFGKDRDNAEAMMNELINKIYIGLLEMERKYCYE